MTPRQKDRDDMTTMLDQLNSTETAKQFGFKFVDDDAVPDAPRSKDTDPERWAALAVFMKNDSRAHNRWAMVKEFDKAGSAQAKASAINNGNNKAFPSSEGWEARYEVPEKKTDTNPGKSLLYVRYTPVVTQAESAE